MANKRIFYAIQQAGIKADGFAGAFEEIHGLQTCGVTTNYNLTQVFEYGQISSYAVIEELPDVQLTFNKVLDGYCPVFLLATSDAPTPTLVGRSASKFLAALAIFNDTNTHATGMPGSEVVCSGQFPASISYSFPVDGNGTEDMTSAGNHKLWARDSKVVLGAPAPSFTGAFTNTDAPVGLGGIVRRNSIQFDTTVTSGDLNGMIADPDCTILPTEVFGISSSGKNAIETGQNRVVHVQSITTSVDLSREALNELGHLGPYTRYANFPVEVTTDITVISISGDMVSATENGIYSTGVGCGYYLGNLRNGTIRIATCEGTRVYLGLKNKLQNISYAGGDTGGGNVTVTYSYRNFNDFTVMHSGDPNANFNWASRAAYLIN